MISLSEVDTERKVRRKNIVTAPDTPFYTILLRTLTRSYNLQGS